MGEAADKALEDFKRDFKGGCEALAISVVSGEDAVLTTGQAQAIIAALKLVKPRD